MNITRGLNRLWLLLTILWFAGVWVSVALQHRKDVACDIAAQEWSKSHPNAGALDKLEGLSDVCDRDARQQNNQDTDEVVYLAQLHAWTLAVPIVVWLLGFGVWWVVQGFSR